VVAALAVGFFALLDVAARRSRLLATRAESPLSRARIVFRKPFPELDGKHLTAAVVEVRYSPGESSPRHSHPCPLVAYVVDGSVRVLINGLREAVYRPGESFHEAPNEIHEFTQNISSTDPAKLLAFFVCDHETPLTVPLDTHERR
jgi:quercetin dioxygenase-like cupin family protein